jgi:hypothetical protein
LKRVLEPAQMMTERSLWNVVNLGCPRQAAGTDNLPKSPDVFQLVCLNHLFNPLND